MQMRRARPLLPDVVSTELRRAIVEGEFPPGAKLPNEDALCTRFGVSRITLREAVRSLIEDGYVIRRQGAGTFVTAGPRLRNSLDSNFSYSDYIESTGMRATLSVLEAVLVTADEATAEALQLEAGALVVRVTRVRSADAKPAIFSIDSLPADIATDPADPELSGSLYRYLERQGHPVDHARTAIAPVIADGALATTLQVAEGTPLQHLDQVDHDDGGRPVMRSQEWHVPAMIELRVYRRGPGPLPG